MPYQVRVRKTFVNNISESNPGMSAFLLRMQDSSASSTASEAGIRWGADNRKYALERPPKPLLGSPVTS